MPQSSVNWVLVTFFFLTKIFALTVLWSSDKFDSDSFHQFFSLWYFCGGIGPKDPLLHNFH